MKITRNKNSVFLEVPNKDVITTSIVGDTTIIEFDIDSKIAEHLYGIKILQNDMSSDEVQRKIDELAKDFKFIPSDD